MPASLLVDTDDNIPNKECSSGDIHSWVKRSAWSLTLCNGKYRQFAFLLSAAKVRPTVTAYRRGNIQPQVSDGWSRRSEAASSLALAGGFALRQDQGMAA